MSNNKPFELVTEELINELLKGNPNGRSAYRMLADNLNDFLSERGKRRYMDDNNFWETKDFDGETTHEALVFSRPIEEEKVGCDHLLFCHVMETAERQFVFTDFDNKYCPKERIRTP